jgi:hypothetical protein
VSGKKFGFIMAAKVPSSYFALPDAEREAPGKAFEELMGKYAGKVDMVRRYWTSAFTTEVTDVFVVECDDVMDLHNMVQDLNKKMGELGGDPDRFGKDVSIWVGVNPDAD